MTEIGFIGAGNMAFAFAKAFTRKGLAGRIEVFDIRPERCALFAREFPSVCVQESGREVARGSEVVILAVKPQDIAPVLEEIGETDRLVISIAAGVCLQRLQDRLPRARVVRVMPNTPCLVGEMAAGYALGSRVTERDGRVVSDLLSAAGRAVALPEELLDAVTGLSGSGPAFVALLIEAFAAAGVSQGLPEAVAMELTLQLFKGTVCLLQETGMSPAALVAMVSSPKGTTLAGRAVMEPSAYREVIAQTVAAATRRSKELGQ